MICCCVSLQSGKSNHVLFFKGLDHFISFCVICVKTVFANGDVIFALWGCLPKRDGTSLDNRLYYKAWWRLATWNIIQSSFYPSFCITSYLRKFRVPRIAASANPANSNAFLFVTTTSTGYLHSINLAQTTINLQQRTREVGGMGKRRYWNMQIFFRNISL